MRQHHHTDAVGQAITDAARAIGPVADALDTLAAELAVERETHRAEVMRLVERAETAEQELARARDELAELANREPGAPEEFDQSHPGLGNY